MAPRDSIPDESLPPLQLAAPERRPRLAMFAEPGEASAGFWIPALLGFAGAALILVFSGLSWAGVATAIVFAAVALVIGVYQVRREEQRRQEEAGRQGDAEHDHADALRELCLRFFPIWCRQLDTSRSSGDAAVGELTRNFANMVERLDTTLAASKSAVGEITGRDGSLVDVGRRSEGDLANVIATLKNLQQSKDDILGQVTGYAKQLEEMAADVQKIALQVRLLSLNGAIEAARAGEAGKAFAVVVGEMHRLSLESTALGTRISKNVSTVKSTLGRLTHQTDAAEGTEVALVAQAERNLAGVVGKLNGLASGLERSVRTMEQENAAIKAQVDDALVALQFQDRISQILAHTGQGLEAVRTAILSGAEIGADLDAWLAEMASGYTMKEEFDNLDGRTDAAKSRAAGSHEVTFF